MSDASWALQSAIFSRLDAALTPVPVYDFVPEKTETPYVVLGEASITDDSDKTANGQEHAFHLHVWSQAEGRKEIKNILSQIYTSLHEQEFTVTGHDLVMCRFDYQSAITLDADGKTYHGVVRYRVITRSST